VFPYPACREKHEDGLGGSDRLAPQRRRSLGAADVRPRLEENGLSAVNDIAFEQGFRLASGMD
jgi:hypothetical protein